MACVEYTYVVGCSRMVDGCSCRRSGCCAIVCGLSCSRVRSLDSQHSLTLLALELVKIDLHLRVHCRPYMACSFSCDRPLFNGQFGGYEQSLARYSQSAHVSVPDMPIITGIAMGLFEAVVGACTVVLLSDRRRVGRGLFMLRELLTYLAIWWRLYLSRMLVVWCSLWCLFTCYLDGLSTGRKVLRGDDCSTRHCSRRARKIGIGSCSVVQACKFTPSIPSQIVSKFAID